MYNFMIWYIRLVQDKIRNKMYATIYRFMKKET